MAGKIDAELVRDLFRAELQVAEQLCDVRAQDGVGIEAAGARAPDPVHGQPLGSVRTVRIVGGVVV
ncbi:hypothetical protein [Rhodococcus jostii]|uniref:hypothetical protein n=1 Tax=Rhodococcus jostii TaxID=132919 RepID=UPI00365860B3